MPCSDSSSSIAFSLDNDDKLVSFEYAKITCGQEIKGGVTLKDFLRGKTLPEFLDLKFADIQQNLGANDEESQFILYLEWDALRSAVIQYLGITLEGADNERCRVTSVEQTEHGTDVALVILPPRELPKILPCSLADARDTD